MNKKIELGHEEEKCGHSVHVLVAEDMITIKKIGKIKTSKKKDPPF